MADVELKDVLEPSGGLVTNPASPGVGDPYTLLLDFGTGAGQACEGNDARLSDDRDPTAHKTSHQSGGSDAIKLDDLAAPDDNTDLDASTSAHGLLKKLPGGTSTYLRADGTFATPSGAGLSSVIWDARVVPAGLHSHSDEFSTNSIANWTLHDPAGYLTTAIDTTHRHLRFSSNPGGSANRHATLYKTAPSANFTFLAYVACDGFSNANNCIFGLSVGQDFAGAPTTSDLFAVNFVPRRQGVVGAVSVMSATAYNASGTFTSRDCEGLTGIWLRMRVIGIGGGSTDIECDWSSDGLYWTYLNGAALTYDVLHYGLYHINPAAQSAQSIAKYFRVFDGVTGPYDSFNGGVLA